MSAATVAGWRRGVGWRSSKGNRKSFYSLLVCNGAVRRLTAPTHFRVIPILKILGCVHHVLQIYIGENAAIVTWKLKVPDMGIYITSSCSFAYYTTVPGSKVKLSKTKLYQM